MKKLFLLLLSFPYCLWGQIINPQIEGITLAPLNTSGKKGIEDTYYINEWVEGSILINSEGKEIPVKQLKYDIAADKLISKSEQGIFEFPKSSLLRFSLNILNPKTSRLEKHTFISGLQGFAKYNPSNFFEVIYEGSKVKFLKKTYLDFQKNTSVSSYNSITDETVLRVEDYYIYYKDKAIEVKKNKKSILEALEGDKKQWEEFIKNNKLNLKKDDDLIGLLKYFDSKIQ